MTRRVGGQMNKILYFKGRFRTAVCILHISCLLLQAQAESPSFWSRGIFEHPLSGYKADQRFSLGVITQEKFHLTGRFVYFQTKHQNPAVTTIDGVRTPDGRFWPRVKCEVANEVTGQWKTLEQPLPRGNRAIVTVKPGEDNMNLMIELDVFRSLLRKYQFGRVVLRTGEAATFELKYLCAPGEDEVKAER